MPENSNDKLIDNIISQGKDKAVEIAKVILDHFHVGLKSSDFVDELIEIAIEYEKKGDFEKAIELYKKAEKRCLAVNDKKGLSSTYGNLGVVYSSLKEYNNAIEFYEKALKIAEEFEDNQEIGVLYNNLGFVYKSIMKYQDSAKYYFKSLKCLKLVNDRFSISATYFNLAEVYSMVEDFETAIEYIDECIKIDKDLKMDSLKTDLKFRDNLEKRLFKKTGKKMPLNEKLKSTKEDDDDFYDEDDDVENNDKKQEKKSGLGWLWKKKF